MGGISLGCLLGQYDRAQSFDVDSAGALSGVGSWAKIGQSSWFFVGSASPHHVHSSAQALRIDVFSRSGAESVLDYAYGRADDAPDEGREHELPETPRPDPIVLMAVLPWRRAAQCSRLRREMPAIAKRHPRARGTPWDIGTQDRVRALLFDAPGAQCTV